MKYAHILTAFYSTPLAILPEKAAQIRRFLETKAAGEDIAPEEVSAIVAARRSAGVMMAGRVALLPVFGILSQRVGALEQASGGISTEEIGATLDTLVADKQVRSILMVFDSPGGSVFGIGELGDKIRAAREVKRVNGIAGPIAASAAYWLLAQTREAAVQPDGQVGSIGVIAAHEDMSKYVEEQQGTKMTLVTSSPYKAEGHPYGPLTDEARAELQRKVDYYHAQFIAAVAKGRGVTENRVEKNFGQGRMLTAEAAVTAGLVDRIGTLGQVLKRMGAGEDGPGANLISSMACFDQGEAGPVLIPYGAFTHNSKTAAKEPDWGGVDKTALPRLAFADRGKPDEKSTWGYPHHWVQDAGGKDDNGVWTTGTLLLHQGGLNAAWSAAQGGRSGEKASAEVIAHLQAHRRALGLDKEGASAPVSPAIAAARARALELEE